MSQLDKLIERIQPSYELRLESHKEPVMHTPAGDKVVVNKILSTPQVAALVAELAAPPHKENVVRKKQATFEYALGERTFTVAYDPQGELVRCVIRLAGDSDIAALAAEVEGDLPEDEEVEVVSSTAATVAAGTAPKQVAPGREPDVNKLLRTMFDMGASDLHLTSGHKPMIRLHGDMQELPNQQAVTPEQMQRLISPILPPHNTAQFEETFDTDFAHEIPGVARFRVNVFKDRFGMGAVFRQIPMEIVTAEKLGLSKEVLDLCFLSKGLVLVTGPTGSGKSTTLCALVDYINRNRKDHIITIEDPIEFVHAKKKCLINQREVHIHTKSFTNALRAALREDPDIVLVGEMRDLETISIAIETAETGHLVFGTLHTSTAASTVDRIIDQFPADRQAQIRTMLAGSLKGVVAQTLCKKADGKGRVAAMEVLFVTSAVSNLIREGKIFQIPSVIQTSKNQGMILLNDALFKLVVDGKVSPEEAYLKAIDKSNFTAQLKSKGITVKMTGGME
jgi:twitching motility protein PilT